MAQFASTLYPQTNRTSPVLLEFRETRENYIDKNLCVSDYLDYVKYGVDGWSIAERDHARRVLERLASLSG